MRLPWLNGPLLLTLALGCTSLRGFDAPEGSDASEGSAQVLEPPATAGPPSLLFRGGQIMTASGPTLRDSDLRVRDGLIAEIGAKLSSDANTTLVDLRGRWVTPGLIDPHSHMGVYALPSVQAHSDGNEISGPFTPSVRAIESFWPQDPSIRKAVAGGVTTIHVLPGSANLVGGQGVTLQPKPALSPRELRFEGAPTTMKMACGENPKRVYGLRRKKAPTTRMASISMLRDELRKAQKYAEKREKDPDKTDFDANKDALARVLSGEILIQNHCYRADDIALRLDLFSEFGIRPRAFHHAVEAYKLRHRLAAAGVGAVVWADWWGFKMEANDAIPAGAALLHDAGVRVSLHSDSPIDIQRLNQEAAKALLAGKRAGLEVDRDDAIRWITANTAWVLGIDEQVGSLEPGKQADLVVWSGDPFSVYSKPDLVFRAGTLIFDRGEPGLYPVSDFEVGRLAPGAP